MRSIKNLFLLLGGLIVVLASCDKVSDLPYYETGTVPVLSASTAVIASQPADSNNVALTLSWTDPNYATDSSHVKYIIQIDSAGKNFSNPATRTINTARSTSFTAKELNSILLARGYAFNVPVDMDVRLISSYSNNNDRKTSNTVRIKMTPYKVPPKIPLPASNRLFIVGGATPGGWNNPVPDYQEMTRLSETVWTAVLNLQGGGSYLLLPVNGSWTDKYGAIGANNSNNPAGDDFKPQGGDLLAPATTGDYRITVDFQTGKFTVVPASNPVPTQLLITGDATPGGWTNTPPTPSQKFTVVSNGVFEITMPMGTTGAYKFLSSPGNWQPQFGGSSATGGDLGANYGTGSDPAAIPAPSVAGNYKIRVSFHGGSNGIGTYTVTKL